MISGKKIIVIIFTVFLVAGTMYSPCKAYAIDELENVKIVISTIDDIRDETTLAKQGYIYPDSYYSLQETSVGRFVISLDLAKNKVYNRIVYEITFGENPTGWLINIGDSATNNGYGGDYATQSNDAELQIVNGTLSIYCSDYASNNLLILEPNCVSPNGKIRIEISDNTVTYYNYRTKIFKSWTSPYLFALNGQSDAEGNTNYEIFTGINRVIDGDYRSGNGVVEAYLIIGR